MSTHIDYTMQSIETPGEKFVMHPPRWRRRATDVLAFLRARWYFRNAAKIGSRVRLWGSPVIYNFGQLVIGDHVQFHSVTSRLEIATSADGRLEIGDRVFINHGCLIGATKLVRIGANATIGPQVMIMDNDFHRLEPERRQERPESYAVILEENVWIGARSIILPGVTIGRDSVIGCGSIVTKEIPPRTLAVGSPARVIREL